MPWRPEEKPTRTSDLEKQSCLAHIPAIFSGKKGLAPVERDFTIIRILPGIWDLLEWGCGALLSGTLLYAQRLTRPSHTPRDQKLSILSIVKKLHFFSGGMGRVHTFSRIKGFVGCYCG